MEKNVLKVRMLGTFSLEYKGKELVLDRNKASKTTQLFQLLMFHTEDGGISKAAMIDALYGRVEVENKNGSLNNTIFRLRKQLKDIGLPDSKYINIQSGMLKWLTKSSRSIFCPLSYICFEPDSISCIITGIIKMKMHFLLRISRGEDFCLLKISLKNIFCIWR